MEYSFSLREIHEAARRVWEQAGNVQILAFYGAMGTGKTTFIRALCEVIGVKDVVSSPTFALVNEYRYPAGGGKLQSIYHLDLYRLKNEEEAIRAGIEDCLYSGAICLVEWPEHAASLLPQGTISLYIKEIEDQKRTIRIVKPV